MSRVPSLTEPSPSDIERYLADLSEGVDRWPAAQKQGFKPKQLERAARRFGMKEQLDEAIADREEHLARKADDLVEKRAFEPDAAPAMVLGYARANSPRYAERSKVELTGPDGGALEIEGRNTSLVDVARVLASVGALAELGIAAPGEPLPASPAVLPDPPQR